MATFGSASSRRSDSAPLRALYDVGIIKGESSEFGLHEGFVVPISMFGGLFAVSFGATSFDTAPGALNTLAFATNLAAGHYLDFAVSARLTDPGMVTGRERDCLA